MIVIIIAGDMLGTKNSKCHPWLNGLFVPFETCVLVRPDRKYSKRVRLTEWMSIDSVCMCPFLLGSNRLCESAVIDVKYGVTTTMTSTMALVFISFRHKTSDTNWCSTTVCRYCCCYLQISSIFAPSFCRLSPSCQPSWPHHASCSIGNGHQRGNNNHNFIHYTLTSNR